MSSHPFPPPAAEAVVRLRQQVSDLHQELVRYRLVVWTAGNVSARVPGHGLFVIKPSGVDYDRLTPDAMIVCDLEGRVVEGDLSPSSDTAAHAYVYRHLPEVGGVVHTHSTYACAWAARGEPVPCVLTAMADEFGAEIPVGPFALIGDDSIGRGIVETLAGHRSPAVLMKSHGVFTIGKDARAAVKAAVMCEDVARTVHISRQLGDPLPLTRADIDRLHDRYQNVYGQQAAADRADAADSADSGGPAGPPPAGQEPQAVVRDGPAAPVDTADPADTAAPADRGALA
ncbi:L-ribulose-5-phosphate 4-epimerase [Streptomyces sp. NPDC087422]|uniref:L-ribulose-5-phosphate 4-epimerase n=1 Tax=Streptomyces sp. NPDC087422 TaxID=3365786 RepID=UPI0038134177